jgi:membrane-associated phospholipid phosphatase
VSAPIKPRFSSRLLFCLCAALLLCKTSLAAEENSHYPIVLFEDIKFTATAPARWQADDWKDVGWASLAVVTTAIAIDAPLRDEMRRQPRGNSFMLQIERLGAEYSLGVVGGFFLAGSLAGNDTALRVAQDGLSASIIASGLITPALKIATGRSRPYEDAGTYNFQGLGANKLNSSFPSGHTTEAFALAAVIASHYEETWVKSSAYAAASLVGLARTYHDAHFASDVLAGALIGNWVGQSVVAHNQPHRNGALVLLPELSPEMSGLRLTGRF